MARTLASQVSFSQKFMQSNPMGKTGKSRILVVEDHPLVRESVIRLLNQQTDLEPCGGVEAFKDIVEAVKKGRPDLVLLDLWLTDGDALQRIPSLKSVFPELPILVLSQLDEALFAERALKLGARGYIMKEQASGEVLGAIRCVLDGHVYVSRKMAARLAARFEGITPPTRAGDSGNLSEREVQVLQFLGIGMSTKEIAEELDLSVKTIETYREHLKDKLGLKHSADLISYAAGFMQGEFPLPAAQDRSHSAIPRDQKGCESVAGSDALPPLPIR